MWLVEQVVPVREELLIKEQETSGLASGGSRGEIS
jgi:hypothetical protein